MVRSALVIRSMQRAIMKTYDIELQRLKSAKHDKDMIAQRYTPLTSLSSVRAPQKTKARHL
jgi:hypothetical protein